jgi:hypothetical protein
MGQWWRGDSNQGALKHVWKCHNEVPQTSANKNIFKKVTMSTVGKYENWETGVVLDTNHW